MSDDPQGQEQEQLVAVRYIGAEGRIINGQPTSYGSIVYLPPSEVATWPCDGPHPYYERADPQSAPQENETAAAGTTPTAPSSVEQLAAVKE